MISIIKKTLYLIQNKKFILIVLIGSILLSALDLLAIISIGGYVQLIFLEKSLTISQLNPLFKYFSLSIKDTDYSSIINQMSIILLVILLLRLIFSIMINFLILKFSLYQEKKLKQKIFENLYNVDYIDYTSKSESIFISSIINYPMDFRTKSLLTFFKASNEIIIIFFISMFLFYNYTIPSIFLTLISIIFFYLYDFLFKNKLDKFGKINTHCFQDQIKYTSNLYNGFKSLKMLPKSSIFTESFTTLINKFNQNALKLEILSLFPRYVVEYVFYFFLIILIISSNYILKDQNPLNLLSAFIYAAIRLIPSITIIINSVTKMRSGGYNLDLLHNLLSEINLNSNKEVKQKKVSSFQNLRLKNIYFSYHDKIILNDLNFELKNKKIVGIYGKSGEGKTTFLDILVGLIKPDKGQIEINNHNKIYGEIYKNLFYYIPQKGILFKESLLFNIALKKDLTPKEINEIKKILKTCFLEEFIIDYDKSVFKDLNLDANNLSGGQLQRLMIARALFSKSKILILDEATNAMDKELVNNIITNIKKNFVSVIMISHDLSIIDKLCDETFELKNGNLIKV